MKLAARLLTALILTAAGLNAATINFTLTNSIGVSDTNAFRLYPVSTPIAANGSWMLTGVPIRITPNASGIATTNLLPGNYVVSNQFLVNQWGGNLASSRGVLFAVPSGTGTYEFTSLVISGFNVFNYDGAAFVASYSNIVYSLGFVPLNTNDARGIFTTNTYAFTGAGVASVVTNSGAVTVTITGGGGTGGTNTVSAGNALLTVVTNGVNYAVSAASQTNSVAFTNDTRVLRFTNEANLFASDTNSANVFTTVDGNDSWYSDGSYLVFRLGASGSVIFSQGGSSPDGHIFAADFIGSGAFLTNLNATELRSGIIPIARLVGIISTNIDAATWLLATNLNGGTASLATNSIYATNVVAGVTNRWRLDIFDTNAVTVAYVLGVSNALTATTNGLWAYSLGVSNIAWKGSNTVSIYALGISNNAVAKYSTNTIAAGTGITIATNTGIITITSTASGGGTGVQTNGGSWTNGYAVRTIATNLTALGQLTNGFISGAKGNIVVGGSGNNTIIDDGVTDNSVIVGGASNTITNSESSSVIVGGVLNIINGGGNNIPQVILGGQANVAQGTYGNILGGEANFISGQDNYAMGRNASAVGSFSFVFNDSTTRRTNAAANEFIVFASNGVGINTNDPAGNGLAVLGPIASTGLNLFGANVITVNTNVLNVDGAGLSAINGSYEYSQGTGQFTNKLTGATCTNNFGTTWLFRDVSLTLQYSLNQPTPVSTNWTVYVTSPSPRTFYGGFLNGNSFALIGQFNSTNLFTQITNTALLKPTNAPSDDYIPIASGGKVKWGPQSAVSSNTIVSIIHSNTLAATVVLGAPGADGTSFDGAGLTNILPRVTWFVSTNGNNSNSGLSISNAFADPMKACSVANSGDVIQLLQGKWSIGTNNIVIPDGVNFFGNGLTNTEIIGWADCAGVEMGRPTGGPQICARGNSLLKDFTVTCDTNALWTLSPNIASGSCIYSGTWAGIGVSYLNPPSHVGFTNVTIRNVMVRRGYFDCFHFNTTNKINITLENCFTESDGGDCINAVLASPTSDSQKSIISIKGGLFRTVANSLYSSYVNGSDPLMFGGSCSVYNGELMATFDGCQGIVTGNGDVPGQIFVAQTTNTVTVIGGSYLGGSDSFIANTCAQGWALWNGSNVTHTPYRADFGNIISTRGTNIFEGVSTNVVGTTVNGQLRISISNTTYYIDLKR